MHGRRMSGAERWLLPRGDRFHGSTVWTSRPFATSPSIHDYIRSLYAQLPLHAAPLGVKARTVAALRGSRLSAAQKPRCLNNQAEVRGQAQGRALL